MTIGSRREKWTAVRVALVLLAVGCLLVPAAARASEGLVQPPAAQDEFVPIDQLPEDEQLPAAPLVIAAYAIAWLAVFGYLWSIWQRTNRVERDLAELSRRIASGRGRP